MNRFTLSVLGVAVGAGALVLAAFATDAATDDGGLGLPGVAAGAPVVVAPSGVAGAPDDSPVEASGTFVPLAAGGSSGGGAGGSSGGGSAGDGSTGDGVDTGTPDIGYPWLVDATDLAPITRGAYGWADYALRFVDDCAEAGGSSCPPGVGGTILLPLGGEPGDFDVFAIDSLPSEGWKCSPVLVAAEGEQTYPIMVAATHPARLEITYQPVGAPGGPRSLVIEADPGAPAYREFEESLDRDGAPPADGVHHCWGLRVLHSEGGSFQIDVEGTSLITGEIDIESRVVELPGVETRERPPVQVYPFGGVLMVEVPVTAEQHSLVRVVFHEDTTDLHDSSIDETCTEIEPAVLLGERPGIGPSTAAGWFGPHGGFVARNRLGALLGVSLSSIPEWPYDPSYDSFEQWRVELWAGYQYEVCVWWLDSSDFSVEERESRVVFTPSIPSTQIVTYAMINQSSGGPTIEPDSYELLAPPECDNSRPSKPFPGSFPGRGRTEPGVAPGTESEYIAQIWCVYITPFTNHPPFTDLQVVTPDGSRLEFRIPHSDAVCCDTAERGTTFVLDVSDSLFRALIRIGVGVTDFGYDPTLGWVVHDPRPGFSSG